MSQDADKQGDDARARIQSQMEIVMQQRGGVYPSPPQKQQQPQPQQQQQQQQQHIVPGFEHLYCQYRYRPSTDHTGAVHHSATAAAAHQQRHPHPSQHPQQSSQYRGPANGGAMHHPMYAANYTSQQHEMAQQLQSHFAAAAAMNQYTVPGYGRGLPDQLDPYLSQHMHQYRPQMELPRGFMLPSTPGAGPYLAPGPQMSYYAHQYPGMMPHMASGGSDSGNTSRGPGMMAEPPPPPPLHSSPTTPRPQQQQQHAQPQPKESILSSLLAARSERLAAAVEDGEPSHGADKVAAAVVASLDASGSSSGQHSTPTGSTAGPLAKKHRRNGGSSLGHVGDSATGPSNNVSEKTGSAMKDPSISPTPSVVGPRSPVMASSPHQGPDVAGVDGAGGGMGAATAAALTAATAMHLTGLRGGYSASRMHHTLGRMSGMAPPMPAGVSMHAGPNSGSQGPHALQSNRPPVHTHQPSDPTAISAMQYMGPGAGSGTVAGARPGSVAGPGPPPQAMGFGNHDAFEEHMRQQEKKLQKRAANRKSAQLSRKRKKALIEELKYENQDLQRHEDILEVIPDPVFAFDALTGGVWFASNSASAQFGCTVPELVSSCFFDLMTDSCSKRLRVLIETASNDIADAGSTLLYERMTVRFKKRKAAILLGELSGRLSRQGDSITAVCSVRPLSLTPDEMLGKGYYGDASVSELAEETSGDQGSSGEDSRNGVAGATSASTAGSSTGVGTACTSIADEGSSSVPSLSSLEVKGGGGGGRSSSGSGSASKGPGRNLKCGGGCSRTSSTLTTNSNSSSGSGLTGMSGTGSAGSTGEGEGSAGSIGTGGISASRSSASIISCSGSGSNNGSEEGEGGCGSPSPAEEDNSDSPLSCRFSGVRDPYREDDSHTDNERGRGGAGVGARSRSTAAETGNAGRRKPGLTAAAGSSPPRSACSGGSNNGVSKGMGDRKSSGKGGDDGRSQGMKNELEASTGKRRRDSHSENVEQCTKALRPTGTEERREKSSAFRALSNVDDVTKVPATDVEREARAEARCDTEKTKENGKMDGKHRPIR